MKKKGRILREVILNSPPTIFLGVVTVTEALVAELAGHKALYFTGYGASAVFGGVPDMDLISREGMFRGIDAVTCAVKIPVMADIDTGYGGVHQAQKTVYDLFRKTDVAGIHIEDQTFPKRCGHIAGKDVIPVEEFVGKFRAIREIRNQLDPSRIIMARTDAFSAVSGRPDKRLGGDIREAVRRGRAYAGAGADLVWAEFDTPEMASAEAFAEGMQKCMPELGLGINISPSFGKTWFTAQRPLDPVKLHEMGYKFMFCTYINVVQAVLAAWKLATVWNADALGTMLSVLQNAEGTPAESIKKLVGVDEYQELEARLSPVARRRLKRSFSKDFKTKRIK